MLLNFSVLPLHQMFNGSNYHQPQRPGVKVTWVRMYSAFRQVFTKKKALKLFQGSFTSVIIRTTPAFFYFFSQVCILNTYLAPLTVDWHATV